MSSILFSFRGHSTAHIVVHIASTEIPARVARGELGSSEIEVQATAAQSHHSNAHATCQPGHRHRRCKPEGRRGDSRSSSKRKWMSSCSRSSSLQGDARRKGASAVTEKSSQHFPPCRSSLTSRAEVPAPPADAIANKGLDASREVLAQATSPDTYDIHKVVERARQQFMSTVQGSRLQTPCTD